MIHTKATDDQTFYKKTWLISFRFFCAFSVLPVLVQDPQNQINYDPNGEQEYLQSLLVGLLFGLQAALTGDELSS